MPVPKGSFGPRILDLAARLAEWSDSDDGLSCLYLTPAHRAVAAQLADWMRQAGMTVAVDAVGNVVGRYAASDPDGKALIVGSHYDTVINAGNYDGRLGILTGLVAIEHLNRTGRRLPFHIDLIAFSEEEGVRFSTPYIGSAAVAGRFDMRWLERGDAGGLTLGEAISKAGFNPEAIPALAWRPEQLLGYIEVHIEQGPVLLNEDLPVGIVTAIAGAVRHAVTVSGEAGHAGTVPMGLRHDAAAAAAEAVLYVERRCAQAPTLVGTVGRLHVPGGAINTIPGRCEFSLDVRASDDETRDAAVADILAEFSRIARRRGVNFDVKEVQRTSAVACSPKLRKLLADAVERAGLRPFALPSGAGHDAVNFTGLTDVGMLFVRCGNGGVSHSPRETITAGDADAPVMILLDVLENVQPS